MTTVKTLLVALDDAAEPTSVLPVARGLAGLVGATLDVLHSANGPPAASTIVKRAVDDSASLIAMGSRVGPESGALASVVEDVLRSATCPVVLVASTGPREPWSLHHLLLPHDGTPTSANAVAPAVALAARAGAELLVLHVAAAAAARPEEPGTFKAPRYVDQPHHEWSAWEDEFLARVRGLSEPAAHAKMRLALATGDIATAVVDFARDNEVDLIALAWRGALDDDRAKTIRRVIRDADAPVVVYRVA